MKLAQQCQPGNLLVDTSNGGSFISLYSSDTWSFFNQGSMHGKAMVKHLNRLEEYVENCQIQGKEGINLTRLFLARSRAADLDFHAAV